MKMIYKDSFIFFNEYNNKNIFYNNKLRSLIVHKLLNISNSYFIYW